MGSGFSVSAGDRLWSIASAGRTFHEQHHGAIFADLLRVRRILARGRKQLGRRLKLLEMKLRSPLSASMAARSGCLLGSPLTERRRGIS